MRPGEWPAALERLDRQSRWLGRSPDRVGLAELMRLYDVPAVSIAVRQDGSEPWEHAYGTTGADVPGAVGPRTLFQACSISKHVAALGVLRLVDQGVLDLDGDVDRYLVSWHLPLSDGWRPVITVRQLLAHTAGLSYNWFRGFGRGEAVPTTADVLHGRGPATSPPVRAAMLPGSGFRYSGSHYAVLQQLVEDVTGQGFADHLRSSVLDPLGMADSSYDQDFPHRREDVARGHHLDGTPLRGGWRVQPELAGAGLWTTPADLCRVGVEVARAAAGRSALLSCRLATEMTTPQVPGGFGLGTSVHTGLRFGHTGGNAGYGCWLFTWPATGTTMALMANNELADEVLWAVLAAADHHHGGTAGPPHPDPADLAGAYRLRDDYTVEIATDGQTITLHAPGQPPLPMHPLPAGRYRTTALDCEITLDTEGGERVLRLRQQNTTQTATRIP
ncbi:serine hydrolase domain-containing protein [Actinosynnema sp. NPDC050436]|uniref:serine hydrolase domain-containing protein n=1 Tax=Actinosynnema sp. NPDC050436 TaxID=3155659 RepID=UPI0033D06FBF